MSPFRPKGRTIWRLKVPNRHGGWADKSTGTRDKLTANAMERMVRDLGPQGKREWDLLDAVHDGRVSLGDLFDAHRMGDLQGLRARLDDVDLRPLIARWEAAETARGKAENAKRYRVHVESLAGTSGPWLRSSFTAEAVDRWFSALTGADNTRRRYHAALSSFTAYLQRFGVLKDSPLEAVARPPVPILPIAFLDLPDVLRVVRAAPEPYQTLFALVYGIGGDISPTLQVCRRDVDVHEREVRVPGEKSKSRDRIALVADWAWPWIEHRCRGLLPDAPLFPGLNRWTSSDVHRRVLKDLKLYRDGITLHAARHHWAVRAIRAGMPIEMVARQIGNLPTTCLKHYGRFVPSSAERKRWEREAGKREKRSAATAGATGGRGGDDASR